ncbi:MAG TPA: hypothetical protein VNA16_09585 [Abditibacteriaceae bacterium]|nr:hypothetical protein [Abditibacteriaceae bacterium]
MILDERLLNHKTLMDVISPATLRRTVLQPGEHSAGGMNNV